jgi:multiple sugar transport system substrate-binding protein
MAIPQMPGRGRRMLTRLVAVTGISALALTGWAQGALAQDNATTLGSNYSDAIPKEALAKMVEYCQQTEGITVTINTTDHGTFQDQLNSYLQGTPDDVFTWFAGYRMRYFADQGLLTPIDGVWEQIGSNFSDAFRAASVGNDGHMYFVPLYNYPWVVVYRKSVFADHGYQIPTTWDDFIALLDQVKADGLIPLAFADKDGWPAQGTFDILNMRLNGYDFHIGLLAGNEKWTDPRVKTVFETWKTLLPYYPDAFEGLTWQEGAQLMVNGDAAMYFLGTFAGQQAQGTEAEGDLDFFAYPTLGTDFDAEMGIDAPIDGYLLSKAPANLDAAEKLVKCFGTGPAQNVYGELDPNNVLAANDADTSGYTEFQQRSAEIIKSSGRIAQYLDRDTIPAFAGPTGMQDRLLNFLTNPDQDLDAYLAGIQELWDTIFAEQ